MDTAVIRGEWAGRVVDERFHLLEWLGGSEWTGAFRTELPEDRSQKAVIKLIPADGANAESRIANWAVTSSLSHPHLMRLFHTGRCEIDGAALLYVVTEYAEESLSEILPERALTLQEAREMLDSVLDALSYIHGKGLVHGDLKPTNIMVVENELKLTADSIQPAGKLENHLPDLGIHDAPECAAGAISPASDVWSLGVTLVEALTQNPPAWDRTSNATPTLPGSLPQPFASIAQDCLRLEPARRCTLGDIRARFEPAQALTEPAGRVAKPLEVSRNVAPGKGRAIFVGAGLLLIAVIAVLLLRSHHDAPSVPDAIQRPEPAAAPQAQPPPQPPVAEHQTVAEGTVKGEVAERVMPDVLPSARASIHGTIKVRVRVAVDPSGQVSNATLDAPGPSKYFARAALEAAQRWRFKPAQRNGQAAPSMWILHFQFRHSADEVTPVEGNP